MSLTTLIPQALRNQQSVVRLPVAKGDAFLPNERGTATLVRADGNAYAVGDCVHTCYVQHGDIVTVMPKAIHDRLSDQMRQVNRDPEQVFRNLHWRGCTVTLASIHVEGYDWILTLTIELEASPV